MAVTLNGPFGQRTLGPTTLTLGRAVDNQLVINEAQVSSRHAQIFPEAQGYSIVDLGSTNGTFINEYQLRPNAPQSLHSGDRIRLGKNVVLIYEVNAAHQPVLPVQIDPTQPLGSASPPSYRPLTYSAPPSDGPLLAPPGQYGAPPQALPGLTMPQPQVKRKGVSRRGVVLGLSLVALLAAGGTAAVIYAPRLHLHLGFPTITPNNPGAPTATATTTTTAPALAATYRGTMTSTIKGIANITFSHMSVTQDQNKTISGHMTCDPAEGRSGSLTGSFSTDTQFTILVAGSSDGSTPGFPTTFTGVINADNSLSGEYKTIGINFSVDPTNPDDSGTWTATPA